MPKLEKDPLSLFTDNPSIELLPRQRYELYVCKWCSKLIGVFNRLEDIRTMTNRSLYKKKNEEKSVLLQEWITYNYEQYTIVFQGILDVALLLTNEIFELGNPYRKCSYNTICDNTRINGTNVHKILGKLNKTTSGHREGKNLLVHRGERMKLPTQLRMPNDVDLLYTAIKLGIEVNDELRELLAEFLAIHTRSELITIMENECREIESQVEKLFDKLLPYYRRMRSFYT